MSEEYTTPDLVELTRHAIESGATGDVDATLSHYTSESVWDMSRVGLGEYAGLESIRRFVTDWIGLYEELRVDVREILDLGGCVTLAVAHMDGRLVGSTGHVAVDYASVITWSDAAATLAGGARRAEYRSDARVRREPASSTFAVAWWSDSCSTRSAPTPSPTSA